MTGTKMDFAILNEHLERAGAQTYMANLGNSGKCGTPAYVVELYFLEVVD